MLLKNKNLSVESTKIYLVSSVGTRVFRNIVIATEKQSVQSAPQFPRSLSLPGSLGRQDFSCLQVGIGSVTRQCNALLKLSKRIQAIISTHICNSSNVHNVESRPIKARLGTYFHKYTDMCAQLSSPDLLKYSGEKIPNRRNNCRITGRIYQSFSSFSMPIWTGTGYLEEKHALQYPCVLAFVEDTADERPSIDR